MEIEKKKRTGRGLFRAFLIIAGLALIADTLFVMTRSNINLGVIMPAVIGAPLLIIGLALPLVEKLCRKSKLARFIAFLVSLAYLLFALLFAATTGLILINSAEPDDGADALIVLGAGVHGNYPTLTLKYRLDAAADYLEANPDTVAVVSGGQGQDEARSEAAVMRDYLVSHGIDEDRVLVEDESQSTAENFRFSKRIIDEKLGEDASVVFVTTRFHVFRAERVAKRAGVDAEGIPAKGVWYITPNDYLRECAAIVVYFLTGEI